MADRIRRVGSALRSASDKLREEDQMAARYADIASEGVERAARYVGSTDLSRAVRDLEGFARRQPALFFGGAFLVGLAAGRFLQSTQHRRENRRDPGLQAAHEHPDTATDWPRPQRAASMPAPETEGLFDTESGRPGFPRRRPSRHCAESAAGFDMTPPLGTTQPLGTPAASSERPLGELVSELWENSETLVRQEFKLAVAELDSRVDDAKTGLQHAAAGGAVLYAGLLAVVAALILLLAEVMAPWLAAALVGIVVMGIGFAVLRSGSQRLRPENMKPERSIDSIRRDVGSFQEAVK